MQTQLPGRSYAAYFDDITATLTRDISTDPAHMSLTQKIVNRALLKDAPEMTLFTVGQVKLSVINHTDQKITFSATRDLLINGQSISTFTEDDCHVIAYHLENQPLMICFEQKDILAPLPGRRFHTFFKWDRIDSNTQGGTEPAFL